MKVTKSGLLKLPQSLSGFDSIGNLFEQFEVDGLRSHYWREEKPLDEVIAKKHKALAKRYNILYADYTYENYEGDVYVLGYDKEEKSFFEVHGGHCSCYGIEGQWLPELCSLEDLKEFFVRRKDTHEKRKVESYYYRSADKSEEFFNWLEGKTNEN